jgi:hypothetical protein
MTKPNRQRPPDIVTSFAKQLSLILADYLTNPDLGNNRHPLKDRIAVKLMMTLSEIKLYRDELLFRSYASHHDEIWLDYLLPGGDKQKLHTESIFYVQTILGKRLTPVAKRKTLPTNLHYLLLMLCRYSLDTNWLRTWIKRKKEPAADLHEAFFNPIAKILKRQCLGLKHMGTLAVNNRERFGGLYLMVGQNSAEILPEYSLFDVIEIVPVPLNVAIKNPPAWYQPLLERILSSLNESYGLLRSCGLSPQLFWDEMSIGKLRELKNLRKVADGYLKSGAHNNPYDAYKQVFSDLQNMEIAGFSDFADFAGSKVGAGLLKTQFESIDSDEEDQPDYLNSIAATDCFSEDMKDDLSDFLTSNASYFSPVTAYYFEQAVIEQRPTCGGASLFNDAEFIRLVAAEKAYAHLDADKLASKLSQKIESILDKLRLPEWLADYG